MKEISWEEGFKTFAEKMTAIQEKYGKESVAFISTGQMPTEDMALLGHVGRNYMKINGDGNTRLVWLHQLLLISKALVLMLLHTH